MGSSENLKKKHWKIDYHQPGSIFDQLRSSKSENCERKISRSIFLNERGSTESLINIEKIDFDQLGSIFDQLWSSKSKNCERKIWESSYFVTIEGLPSLKIVFQVRKVWKKNLRVKLFC